LITKNIRIIIFLAILGVVGLIINQVFWVRNAVEIQENTIASQKENLEVKDALFIDQVTLALVEVRDEMISLNKEASGIYLEPVQQITTNYFVVSFYDTLNSDLLENLLVEKFQNFNIKEAFEIGVYDCFTDSVIFDKYVNISSGVVSEATSKEPQKWNHDGHYFGVYFPERTEEKVAEIENVSTPLMWSTLIVVLVLFVFMIAIYTILRQKRLSEVKTDFINNMTHELKTPIATISLSSEVLKSDNIADDPDRIKRYAHIISAENSRLESQVERVLQLAKLDKGKIELKNELLSIHEIIEKAIPAVELIVKQKMGEIIVDLSATNDAVFGDKVHLTNVFYNLLDNAVKYSPESPRIKISTVNNTNGILIMVSDKGKGMTKEQLKQVFDKFYRVPTGSVHDVKGFGLGLFYVKEIVEAHTGSVKVNSTLGEGSEFKVTLKNK